MLPSTTATTALPRVVRPLREGVPLRQRREHAERAAVLAHDTESLGRPPAAAGGHLAFALDPDACGGYSSNARHIAAVR